MKLIQVLNQYGTKFYIEIDGKRTELSHSSARSLQRQHNWTLTDNYDIYGDEFKVWTKSDSGDGWMWF